MPDVKYPARFVLQGQVLNVFQAPEGENAEEKRRWGGDYRLQLMSADHLRNGETKLVPTDVSIGEDRKEWEKYQKMVGQVVKLPVTVGFYNNKINVRLAAGDV